MHRTWGPVASTCVSVSRVFRWHAWNLGPYRKHYAEPGLEEHIASLCTWEVEANTYLSTYLLGNNALRVSHWDKPSRSWKCSSIFTPGDSGLSNTMYSTQVSSAIFSGMFEEWTVTHLAFDTGGGVCLESCVSLERFLSRLQFLSDPFMNLERLGGLDWCVGRDFSFLRTPSIFEMVDRWICWLLTFISPQLNSSCFGCLLRCYH